MTVSLSDRAFVTPRALCKDLGDEAILLDLETETYFGLNPVGNRILQLLASGRSIGETLETLLAEYDVPPGELERDVLALIEDLVQKGLLRVGSA
jgi:hypothetical protein